MRNLLKAKTVFTMLILALAFAVPVSNTVTEGVGITKMVSAKTKKKSKKKKSKKAKKQGKVITVKKADDKTARQIYNMAMAGKTFTLQYKCKSTSKKNIKAGKRQLQKLCSKLDDNFPYYNTWAVDNGVHDLLTTYVYNENIKQSGKYVFVVYNVRGKDWHSKCYKEQLENYKIALDLVQEFAQNWVKDQTEWVNSNYQIDIEGWTKQPYNGKTILENAKAFVEAYEAGNLTYAEDREHEREDLYGSYAPPVYTSDMTNWIENTYKDLKTAFWRLEYTNTVINAIQSNQFYKLDDPIRVDVVTGGLGLSGYLSYDYAKYRKYQSGKDYGYYNRNEKDILRQLHDNHKFKGVCGELDHAWSGLWNTMYYKNSNSKSQFILTEGGGHEWVERVVKTKTGQAITFMGENDRSGVKSDDVNKAKYAYESYTSTSEMFNQ